LPLKCKSNTV